MRGWYWLTHRCCWKTDLNMWSVTGALISRDIRDTAGTRLGVRQLARREGTVPLMLNKHWQMDSVQ